MENKQLPYHKFILVSIFYFLIVALIGTALRSVSYFNLPFEFGHLVHSHSHIAFQGWIYTSIFLILTRLFIPTEKLKQGNYALQFQLTSLVLLGVLVSFAIQGYGLYSIIFSTLFQAFNYWFIYRFFKDIQTTGSKFSLKFIKSGLGFGLLSSLFPYIIGFVSAKGLGETEIYKSLVYSFMHLQYNAWFLFVIIGLFYELLHRLNQPVEERFVNRFYWCFTISVLPAISLSLLGMSFSDYLLSPSWFSIILQSFGLFYFFKSFSLKGWFSKSGKEFWLKLFGALFIAAFPLKVTLQTLSILPVLRDLAFQNKLIFLAYLHLSLIGVISFVLITLVIHLKWIAIRLVSKIGLSLFFMGFICTELILATGGIGTFYNSDILILGSASMALGVLFLILNQFLVQTISKKVA